MTDSIGSPMASAQVDASQPSDLQTHERDKDAFLDIFDQGLETLSQRPEIAHESDSYLDGLTGDFAGDVGNAKSEIVGGEAARAEQSSEANNATLEERITGLYTELTHYQVAWKIAQNVQRDISQVLRGS